MWPKSILPIWGGGIFLGGGVGQMPLTPSPMLMNFVCHHPYAFTFSETEICPPLLASNPGDATG